MTQQLKSKPVLEHVRLGETPGIVKMAAELTKGTDELSLDRPSEGLDQGGRGESSKHHVVQEHDIKVTQPVVPAKVSQEIESSDS